MLKDNTYKIVVEFEVYALSKQEAYDKIREYIMKDFWNVDYIFSASVEA
jgi:hypothetical protein